MDHHCRHFNCHHVLHRNSKLLKKRKSDLPKKNNQIVNLGWSKSCCSGRHNPNGNHDDRFTWMYCLRNLFWKNRKMIDN